MARVACQDGRGLKLDRRLTTIVAMDVVGYSSLMERDEVGTLDLVKGIRATVVDPAVVRHTGRIFKLMGDGILAEFSSVVEALQCAMEIQHGCAAESKDIRLRIGIHVGDIVFEAEEIYGDGVNLASRVESLGVPWGNFSRQFYPAFHRRCTGLMVCEVR